MLRSWHEAARQRRQILVPMLRVGTRVAQRLDQQVGMLGS